METVELTQPKLSSPRLSWNAKTFSSSSVSHVSEVAVCRGMSSVRTVKTSRSSVPSRRPQHSSLRLVCLDAHLRKAGTSEGGRLSVRREGGPHF